MLAAAISTLMLVMVSAFATRVVSQQLTPHEAQLLQLALGLQVLATGAQLMIIFVFGDGMADYVNFHRNGAMIARAIETDFWGVAPRSIGMILQQDVLLNVPLPLEAKGGGSTAAMWAIAAWGHLFLGSKIGPMSLAAALFAFSGKVCLYLTARHHVRPALRRRVMLAAMLVPSAVFWTGGLIKEAIAVGGLGWVVYGLFRVYRRRYGAGLLFIATGFPFLMIKSYLLLPLVMASAAYAFVDRSTKGGRTALNVRPLTLIAAVGVAWLALLLVGELVPKFAISTLGDQAATMQYHGSRAGGASAYRLGDPSERSLLGQLSFAPLALLTALFRPSLLDARSPLMLMSAFETTALLGIIGWLALRQGLRWPVKIILRTPILAFCVAFWLPTAVGVGLISNTLGSLSRYRVPMLPFLATTALVVQAAPLRRRESWSVGVQPSPAQAPASAPEPGRRERTNASSHL